MPLPKRRQSKARRNKRRSHDALSLPAYTNCTNCGAQVSPHSICTECGYYRGKQLLTVKEKKKKK